MEGIGLRNGEMQLDSSIATLIVAGILGIFVWFARIYVRSLISSSVEEQYAKIRAADESDLRKIEARLQELSGFAIAAAERRQALLQERRLNAIDKIWTKASDLSPFRFQAKMLQSIDIPKMAERADRDPKIQEFAGALLSNFEEKNFSKYSCEDCRPYVSDRLWAAYDAYVTVMISAYAILKAISGGIPKAHKLFDWEKINNLLKIALPHHTQFIEKYPNSAAFFLGDNLESNLLKQVRLEIEGVQPDAEALAKAGELIELAEQLRSNAQAAVKPD